jgi:predicted ATPase
MVHPRDELPPYFVITGGPGAGKTTLIDALSQVGFAVARESGRQVIREQQSINGNALPWLDPAAFAEAMLTCDLKSYSEARHRAGPVFFDRGVPDIVGYLHLENLPIPGRIESLARRLRYRKCVFICPPWPEIYTTDDQRRQSKEIAERTYQSMVETYTAFDYELVEVPRASVEERTRFVRDRSTLALTRED